MRTVTLAVVPLLAAAIAACSARSASTNEPGRSGSLIEQSEIRAAHLPTAYDLVERLRPEWLRTAGVRSDHTDGLSILVYVDNARYGGPESLRQIPGQTVTAIRLLRGSEVNSMLTSMSARGVGSVIHVHTTVQDARARAFAAPREQTRMSLSLLPGGHGGTTAAGMSEVTALRGR